jgi:hypothetical protein
MKIEVAFNWVRDLSFYLPSKALVRNLNNLITIYQQKSQFPAFRNAVARTVNLILIRNPVTRLCEDFKRSLPGLAKQMSKYK